MGLRPLGAAAKLRSSLRELGVATLLAPLLAACHSALPSQAPAVIALASKGEQLYVAEGEQLWSLAVSQRRGLARASPRALAGPCEDYVDLEVWTGELFASCRGGRVFALLEPEEGELPVAEGWREISRQPSSGSPDLIALQRSDSMLLGVREDGALEVLASVADIPAGHSATLDRFRGSERGGPEQIGVATFAAHDPLAAHAFSLRGGPQLVLSADNRTMSCSIRQRGALVSDLSLAALDRAVAVSFVDRRGRGSLVYVHFNPQGFGPAFAGAFDPRGGRRLQPRVRCRQL